MCSECLQMQDRRLAEESRPNVSDVPSLPTSAKQRCIVSFSSCFCSASRTTTAAAASRTLLICYGSTPRDMGSHARVSVETLLRELARYKQNVYRHFQVLVNRDLRYDVTHRQDVMSSRLETTARLHCASAVSTLILRVHVASDTERELGG